MIKLQFAPTNTGIRPLKGVWGPVTNQNYCKHIVKLQFACCRFITVLAPTNAGIEDTLDALGTNLTQFARSSAVTNVLDYHLLPSPVLVSSFFFLNFIVLHFCAMLFFRFWVFSCSVAQHAQQLACASTTAIAVASLTFVWLDSCTCKMI